MTPTQTAHEAAAALALGPGWLNAETMLDGLGSYAVLGVCLIVFAECGLLIGFFLPGDSLLFTAGLFVANDYIDFPIWLLCALLTGCAVLGNLAGYYLGRRFGPAIFSRPDSRLFKYEHVTRTQQFFDKFGAGAIVLARFVPVVRTFITVMAGVAGMNTRRYVTYSVLGGTLWATGVTLLGYWLGRYSLIKDNVEPLLILIVAISVVPIVVESLRKRHRRRAGHAGAGAARAGNELARAELAGEPE